MSKEPEQLRRGKAFHKLVQKEWVHEAEGDVTAERVVLKVNGLRGRVDVFVNDDDPDGVVAIVEIKATDWDRIKQASLRRNVRRQIRQVWGYIGTQILGPDYVPTGEHKSVSPGIIFPRRPQDPARMAAVEAMFWEEGIVVVWHDESLEECRARNRVS